MINTISTRDLFKTLHYHPRPRVLLRALCIYGRGNKQLLANIDRVEYVLQHGVISTTCCHCGEHIAEEDFDYVVGYWSADSWHIVHKKCAKEFKEAMIYKCQSLDKDCNDCRHFEREEELGKGVFGGNCLKFNTKLKAYYCTPTNNECFEHRKLINTTK